MVYKLCVSNGGRQFGLGSEVVKYSMYWHEPVLVRYPHEVTRSKFTELIVPHYVSSSKCCVSLIRIPTWQSGCIALADKWVYLTSYRTNILFDG